MGGGFDRAPAPGKNRLVDQAPSTPTPGKRTLTERFAPSQPRSGALPVQSLIDGPDAGAPVQRDAVDFGYGDIVAASRAPAAPIQRLFGRKDSVQRKESKDDAAILANQATLKNTDVEIPALEGALLATRKEAVKRGLLSQSSFDAGLALSQAMTLLQPAVAAKVPIDKDVQDRAALAAQRLFASLHAETADEKNFQMVASGPDSGAVTSVNRYTDEARVTTSVLFWSRTTEVAGWLQRLPDLIRQGQWSDAFRGYRCLLDGLDLWVADQLRKTGKGTPDDGLGNTQEHYARLRTGLEQIAEKHATRLPALFHPDAKTVESEKAADRPVADTIPMNVYFWKDQRNGTFHLYDVTTPSQPHEQTIDRPPTAAIMAIFFEEVARYPEGEVRYTLPGGAAGVAPTSGKTKWYEWVGYAGLVAAGLGLALLTGGASVAATVCFAAGAVAGGVSAGGHLSDTVRLGTATRATVVLDVAQIAASFASFGAMSITVKAGSAAAAATGSRWFVPLVGTAAGADVVQLVALTEITVSELNRIERGAGSAEDRQRAAAVLLTQLLVTTGLTALSVQGARNARSLAGQPLELVEQNGVNMLRVVGDESAASVAESKPAVMGHDGDAAAGHARPAATRDTAQAQSARSTDGHSPTPGGHGDTPRPSAGPSDAERWLAELESGLGPEEKAKLAKMKRGKTPEQTRDMLGSDPHAARERVRTELRAERDRAAVGARSKQRVAELRQLIADRGLMDDPEVREIVGGTTVRNWGERIAMLRDKLIARIVRSELEHAHPGADVFDNVKLLEKVREANLQEWKAGHPGEDARGLTERNDGLYIERGEIDIMVIERPVSGKGRVIAREEVKTGFRDSNADARAQLDDQTNLLRDGAASRRSIRLEVRERDITSEIDLASDAAAKKTTRGPAGKVFDNSLGVTATDLEKLCSDLLATGTPVNGGSP